jgi:hypothetical protein
MVDKRSECLAFMAHDPLSYRETPQLRSISPKAILLANSFELRRWGSRHQPYERGDAGFGRHSLQEPLAEPEHVQPYRRQNMSQMDPCEAHVAGPSQACAPCPARDGAFTPGTAGILCLKHGRRFPLPGHLQGLVLRLGPDGERARGSRFFERTHWAK